MKNKTATVIFLNILVFSHLIISNLDKNEIISSDYAKQGLDSIKYSKKYLTNIRKNIKVAMIDSGVDANHIFLKNNVIQEKYIYDDIGHGTHVAGIIKAVNPFVMIQSYKYTSKNTNVDTYATSRLAFKKAIINGANIISYSGGGPKYIGKEYDLIKEAQEKGILVIVAAGNNGKELNNYHCNYYPACYDLDNIIVVGAMDYNYYLTKMSNYGKKVDIVAPGYKVASALPNNQIGRRSGTSMATPFVSGLASLIMAKHPHLDYKGVKRRLLKYSSKASEIFQCEDSACSNKSNYKILNAERSLASENAVR